MNTNEMFLGAILTVLASLALCSCDKKISEPTDDVVFIEDASLEEERQTLSPGDVFHLLGTGYRQTDNVLLTFTWETGDVHLPVGTVSGIYAKKKETTPEGISAVLPYRYPAADVEVSVMREGKRQKVGSLRITDGQSPKELRLYGISAASKKIDGFTLDINNAGQKSLETALPENFHSVINVPRSFGLCGISGNGEHRAAVYVDFFTGEAETLATDVLALFMTPANAAVAVVCRDGLCTLQTLPIEVGADYMTKSRTSPPVQPTFKLPDGLRPEYFGDCPGVFVGTATSPAYLLSANRGNGNWTAVMLDKDGFRKLEDIEAAALIPFRAGDDAGYIFTYEGGPSLFRPVNPENGVIDHAIHTIKTERIISATSTLEKPSHILLNFSEASGKTQIYDLDWKAKSLSSIALPNQEGNYTEVLMAN